MTQEEKSILLQDLCTRLPYNLYVRIEEFNVPKNEAITEGFIGNYLKDNRCNDYDADGILYVDIDDHKLKIYKGIENKKYPEEKYELMKKWGECYVEDDVYHFVNYGL